LPVRLKAWDDAIYECRIATEPGVVRCIVTGEVRESYRHGDYVCKDGNGAEFMLTPLQIEQNKIEIL
jgi:hypothetical protein